MGGDARAETSLSGLSGRWLDRSQARTHQAELVREDDRLHPVAQLQLVEDAGDVRLDGALADEEPVGDLRVREPRGDQRQHLPLALRQLLEHARVATARWVLHHPLDEPPRHGGRQQHVSGRRRAHAGDDFLRVRMLEQEPAGARGERVEDVPVQVVGRQDHDPGRRLHPDADQAPRGLDPVHARHADVHEDDVGAEPAHRLDRLDAVCGLAHDLDVRLGVQEQAEAGSDHRVVVDDDDADRHGDQASCPGAGRVATTWNPPPATGPASRLPPNSATRSRIPIRPRPSLAAAGVGTPAPSSTTRSRRPSRWYCRLISTCAPGACLRALVVASCTMRYADSSSAGGSGAGWPTTRSRTFWPAARARATRSSSWARLGSGSNDAELSLEGRSTPSSRASSSSATRAVSAIDASTGVPGPAGCTARWASACTAIALTWCVTTSWSSRAIRARSSSAARCRSSSRSRSWRSNRASTSSRYARRVRALSPNRKSPHTARPKVAASRDRMSWVSTMPSTPPKIASARPHQKTIQRRRPVP